MLSYYIVSLLSALSLKRVPNGLSINSTSRPSTEENYRSRLQSIVIMWGGGDMLNGAQQILLRLMRQMMWMRTLSKSRVLREFRPSQMQNRSIIINKATKLMEVQHQIRTASYLNKITLFNKVHTLKLHWDRWTQTIILKTKAKWPWLKVKIYPILLREELLWISTLKEYSKLTIIKMEA